MPDDCQIIPPPNGAQLPAVNSTVKLQPFTDEEYYLAEREMNLKPGQLNRAKNLATLGKATGYVGQYNLCQGILTWTRSQIIDDVESINLALQSPVVDDEVKTKLYAIKSTLYHTMIDDMVPGMLELEESLQSQEKAKTRKVSFAPGASVAAAQVQVHTHFDGREAGSTTITVGKEAG
jgi:hypothetical protein